MGSPLSTCYQPYPGSSERLRRSLATRSCKRKPLLSIENIGQSSLQSDKSVTARGSASSRTKEREPVERDLEQLLDFVAKACGGSRTQLARGTKKT